MPSIHNSAYENPLFGGASIDTWIVVNIKDKVRSITIRSEIFNRKMVVVRGLLRERQFISAPIKIIFK